MRNVRRKKNRLEKKNLSLEAIIEELREGEIVTSRCADLLANSCGDAKQTLIGSLLDKKGKFSEPVKSFAMTLQFYSTKAYKYVKETLGIPLPAPSTLRTWYAKMDGDAGFTRSSFSLLQDQVERDKAGGKKTVCSLMMDEMAIRKHVEFDGSRYEGFVDLGTGGDVDDGGTLAKDALVLMAVGVNSRWKIPLGFFL